MVKNFIAAAILGLGIAGFLFILQNSDSLRFGGVRQPLVQNTEPQLAGNNLVSNRPFVEQLDEKSLKAASKQARENLTESFTKNLAERIAKENAFGLPTQNGENFLNVPDPNQLALELMAEAATKFDTGNLIPKIKNADLKVTKDTREALLAYAKQFDEINLGLEVPDLENQNEFAGKISDLIQNYKKAVAAFYELAVPELMLNVHKTNLAYLAAELTLLEKIGRVEQDPMGAMLASKNFLEIEEEFKKQYTESVLGLDTLKLLTVLNKK